MTKKTLSYLIEAEMEKATVFMAAKEITNKLQKVVETLAKIPADDLLPLGDAMRELFDSEQASSFESNISAKVNELVDAVRNARNEIADQIDALQNGEPMNDLSNTESHEDMFPDARRKGSRWTVHELATSCSSRLTLLAMKLVLATTTWATLDDARSLASIPRTRLVVRPRKASLR
jgi:hypothetical protein